MSDKPIEQMTYAEFNTYCNARACDGRWSWVEALACVGMISEVRAAVKGKLFKRRAAEAAWSKLKARLKMQASRFGVNWDDGHID